MSHGKLGDPQLENRLNEIFKDPMKFMATFVYDRGPKNQNESKD
jgi:hypothetical protein